MDDFNSVLAMAKKGDPVSMHNVAYMYYCGEGVKRNEKVAFLWWEKSAKLGCFKAIHNLTRLFQKKSGSNWNQKALRAYRKEIENGNGEAMLFMGVAYDCGLGVKENSKKAILWFEKAAQKGNVEAMMNIAQRYLHGYYVKTDQLKGLFWYEKAIENGSVDSMRQLAETYRSGKGKIEQNIPKALLLYEKAAENGNVESMFDAGILYMDENFEKAMFWFEKAMQNGDKDAMYILGEIYYNGTRGVKKDIKKAIEMYEKAADKIHYAAMKCLGRAYLYGEGVEKDYQKAVSFFLNARSSSWLRNIMEDDNAFEWLKREALNGNNDAINAFGLICENNFSMDYMGAEDFINSKALYFLKKLAEEGNVAAMYQLGKLYEYWYGIEPSDIREKKALVLYQKAAKMGNKDAVSAYRYLRDSKKRRREWDREEESKTKEVFYEQI
jgi:TPR repeat protein